MKNNSYKPPKEMFMHIGYFEPTGGHRTTILRFFGVGKTKSFDLIPDREVCRYEDQYATEPTTNSTLRVNKKGTVIKHENIEYPHIKYGDVIEVSFTTGDPKSNKKKVLYRVDHLVLPWEDELKRREMEK